MNCASPQREHAALLDLEGRVGRMEGCMARYRVMARDADGWPTFFLPLLSMERTDGATSQFTILWGTYAGASFKVEESADGVLWHPAADIVEAHPTAVSTSWTSGLYGLTENPYFRATLLRPSLVCCALPDEELPRFFERIIGPTGGVQGGCTDCSGDFPDCA